MRNIHFLLLACIAVFCFSTLLGCGLGQVETTDSTEQPSTKTSGKPTQEVPTANNSSEKDEEQKSKSEGADSTWDKVKRLYSKAKEKGSTSASDAKQWVSDMLGSASDSTSKASKDATKWAQDLYQKAVDQGETQATNVKDWVMEDISKGSAWEYKVVMRKVEKTEKQMNELGQQRWECFEVEGDMMFFKRRPKSYLSKVPVKDLMKLIPLIGIGGEGGE